LRKKINVAERNEQQKVLSQKYWQHFSKAVLVSVSTILLPMYHYWNWQTVLTGIVNIPVEISKISTNKKLKLTYTATDDNDSC